MIFSQIHLKGSLEELFIYHPHPTEEKKNEKNSNVLIKLKLIFNPLYQGSFCFEKKEKS